MIGSNTYRRFKQPLKRRGDKKQMIISVASGKGGTGKTTIATNLAASLEQGVQLLDCDVEAPNAHLFLPPAIEKKETVNLPVPDIDFEKCTFCKKCMDICRFGAIAILKNSGLIFDTLCHSCGGCFEVCPENAIYEKERSVGEIEQGWAGHISFVHGRLNIGQVMVPPIIKKIKALADPDRVKIIDAPPGTSCPVVAAVNQTDFILLVTEPTPFGLYDLKLAVETARLLDIPHGLIINRADLGNDDIRSYADKEDLPILMEIPFEKRIAQAYANGQLIADVFPWIREKFQALFRDISQLIQIKEPT